MYFTSFLKTRKNRGRKGYELIKLFVLIVYGNAKGVRSIPQIVELCKRNIRFIYLAQGARTKKDAFYKFINETEMEVIE